MIGNKTLCYEVQGIAKAAYLYEPDSPGPWPVVLLAHDGVGLEDYQRQCAAGLAERGYLVLAMDYLDGEVFFNRPDAMLATVMPLLADAGQLLSLGEGALAALLSQPGADAERVAALGFGAGGQLVLELARTGTQFRSVALIHPAFPDPQAADWSALTGEYCMITGSEDPICTPRQVLAFGRILQEAGATWWAQILGSAEHAFWARPRNPDGTLAAGSQHAVATVPGVGYHQVHTDRAWRTVLELFDDTLGAMR